MGGNEESLFGSFQYDVKQVLCVQTQNRPAVGMDVSDLVQPGVKPGGGFQVRQKYQVVGFPRFTRFFINVADFRA